MTGHERVKLRGILKQTASSAAIGDDGSLLVELYDFSDAAHKCLGNDVAFILTVDATAKDEALVRLLRGQPTPDAADRDELLLHIVQQRFSDYLRGAAMARRARDSVSQGIRSLGMTHRGA